MTARRPSAAFATAYPSATGLMATSATFRERRWRRTPSVNPLRVVGTRDDGGDPGASYQLPPYRAAATDQAASSAGVPTLTQPPAVRECNCG